MLCIIYFLLLLLSLIFLKILTNRKKHENHNHPPGPKGLPIIGNLHQLNSSDLQSQLFNLGKIYGPVLSLKLGRRRTVVIQSATLAKEVLKTQDDNFCNRPSLTGQRRLSYDGLDLGFSRFDEHYREMRKITVVHLLGPKKIQSSASIRREEVSRIIQKISSLASASKVVNFSQLIKTLVSSIICRAAFGKRYKDEELERIDKLLKQVQFSLASFYMCDYVPIIGGLIDKLTGLSSTLESVFKDMDEFYEDIINDHVDPNRLKHDPEDIVGVLLRLSKESHSTFNLTLDDIKALLMDIIAAGTDTGAVTVIWAMSELMKNPEVMKKVQNELRTSIQHKTFIDEEDLSKLPYLKAVVKETFRFHPATPLLLIRETIQKCQIQGYDILPQTLVLVNVWAIGRDPKFWKDPQVFMPDRFLGSSVDYKGQNFELIPFGAGKRICPGMLLGVLNVEISLANLLYSFDWELPSGLKREDIDTDMLPGISMHKKNPLCLVAKEFSRVLDPRPLGS